MAKLRRVVRKVPRRVGAYFDEQLWPIYIALVVLGGFSMGVSAAYLRFSGVPWYANAWTSLIGIPLVVAAFMVGFRLVDNRMVRRSMQLSVVLCAILHVALVVQLIETRIYTELFGKTRPDAEIIEARPGRIVPEYHASQFLPEQDRPRQDFERPVEAETPEPQDEPDQIVRQETREEPETPPEMQPVPVPENVATTEPNVIRKPDRNEAAPREAPQASRLSRQVKPSDLTTSQMAAAASPTPTREAGMEARPSASPVTRQTSEPRSIVQQLIEPTTQTSATVPQVARRAAATSATPETTSTPTLERQVATPRATPRAQVASSAEPAATRETSPSEIAPANTATIQRTTTSTEIARAAPEPSMERTSDDASPIARRQNPAEAQPADIAQTSSPVTNRQPRATTRPDIGQTAAAAVSPASTSPSAETQLVPQASAMQRTAAAATGGPSTATPRAESATAQNVTSQTGTRRASLAQSSPETQTAASRATSRSPSQAATNVVTNVGDVPTNAGPQQGTTLAAASSSVSRQPSSGTAAVSGSASTAAPEAAGTSPRTSSVARAQLGPTLTAEPTRAAGSSPRRATAIAAAATSPTAVESPAGDVASPNAVNNTGGFAATGSGDPAIVPSRLALSRGETGVAGGGRAINVEGSQPGSTSPSLIASGAARRAEATQTAEPGDALSPSSATTIARSRAGADMPTASLRADASGAASDPGAAQLAELTASSAATIARADANATQGETTAARGSGEVDLGPTVAISEPGIGRGSGGGQPEIGFDAESQRLARSAGVAGGAPLVALSTPETGDVAAPAGTSGGQPALGEPGPATLAATRTADAQSPGGQSASSPQAEEGGAALLADASLSRADAAQGGAEGEPGIGDLEDEEERRRRLARAGGGTGPQVAMSAIAAPDMPDGATDGRGNGTETQIAAASTDATRGAGGDGTLAGGTMASGPEASAENGEPGEVQIARAEQSDGSPGEPTIGGGTNSPTRAAAGPAMVAATQADTIQMAGAPTSGGAPDGAPLEAQGLAAARIAGGAAGELRPGQIGAAAGPEIVDVATAGAPGDGPGRRQASPSTEDGPAIADATNVGAPGRQATEIALSGGSTTVAAIPETGPNSAVAQADMDHALSGMATSPMTRQTDEGLAVNIEAPDGPGGLGADFTLEVGLNTRQARTDSLQVHMRSARFVKSNVGGLPSVSTAAIAPTDAFVSRGGLRAGTTPGGGRGSPAPRTEEAIEMGLAFLARHQLPDGGWSLQGFPEETQLATDTAATALAVLAFQGAGYNHREHHYKDVVRGGLDFLVKSQKDNGDLFVPLDDNSNASVWLYSHSLAAIALCEAYGMTQDPELKTPAQKAIDFIVAGQHTDRGGWRYSPGVGSDTSVTGWMMMALKSGELAGLNVPKEPYQKIDKWLDQAQQSRSEPHLYRYNPYAPLEPVETGDGKRVSQAHGRTASKSMTAVGLLMRLYGGWKRDNPNMIRGADFLKENLPSIGTARQPQRDTYYWYYGTQVMFHMGGDHWNQWNSRLHPLLVDSQLREGPLAGSWNPRGAVPDRWGPHGGRLYVTTLNLLSLEVYYRHLPLYEDAAK